jgi:hypothetical protein
MRTPNYRQAKRHREETRKAKHQQKLDKKLQRGPDSPPAPGTEPPAEEKGTEDTP